ncbi:MAG: ribonuclease H [Flavobacteriia bacterium]|nr:MAG: ribonuclease H [Flavobacteriia bacterium]
MAKQSKYYVVWQGHKPGIYTSWTDCQKHIKGFVGAKFKAFKNRSVAEKAFAMGYAAFKASDLKDEVSIDWSQLSSQPVMDSIAVDAACSGNPGTMEYRGVNTGTAKELFRQGPFPQSTNNIGEFLALVHALALMKQTGDSRPIYSDSRTAMSWVRQKKVKTSLKKTGINAGSFDLIVRAEQWLKTNSYPNKILKWETKIWGEIPADFGRK